MIGKVKTKAIRSTCNACGVKSPPLDWMTEATDWCQEHNAEYDLHRSFSIVTAKMQEFKIGE